jgi:ABC-type uncharacterized transport system substrate-binding protein
MHAIGQARSWGIGFVLAAAVIGATPASAHPHVFVSARAEVQFGKGTITGLKEVWTFDEFYSAMATEGLDTNKDGKLDRQELSELAKVNMEGLREFGYFTHPTLAGGAVKFGEVGEYWLEHSNGVLSLHFVIPFEQPVLTDAPDFAFSIFDPSYFIAFELEKSEPVTLGKGAPASCKVAIGVPKQQADDAKKLGESFFAQLGGNSDFASGFAKTVSVTCGR